MITCKFEKGHEVPLRHVTVDAIVVRDGQLMLERRRPDTLEGGKLCLPGGYLDRDETTAEGILREVREETGHDGRIVELFRIVDDPERRGEDRQNVTFVYLVELGEKVGEPDDETDGGAWFPLDALPPEEEWAFDHRDSVLLYLEHLQTPKRLPII